MDTRTRLIAATVVSLLAEAIHTAESNAEGKPRFPFLTGVGQGTHDQPHTHADLETESHIFPARNSFLLGTRRQQPELFRFTSIVPMLGNMLRLLAAPAFGFSPDAQLMYGTASLPDFLDWLSPRLPAAQFAAFQRRYSGESSEAVQLRSFDRRELERMGMTFRPHD